MNSQNKKRIIFGLLLIVMMYIWGSNFGWFASSNSVRKGSDNSSYNEVNAGPQIRLSYEPPRINPFLIKEKLTTETPRSIDKAQAMRALSAPPRPSLAFTFVGFIDQPPHSQAVISGHDNTTIILESGDSLSDWKLVRFSPDMAVFQFDKAFDTLLLTK
ncbi:MAG: hypothetical protein R3F48_12515 [Candidatus Zixiibacteriota bacterium]